MADEVVHGRRHGSIPWRPQLFSLNFAVASLTPCRVHHRRRSRLAGGHGLDDVLPQLTAAERIVICACGTSWHAGLLGEYLIEQVTSLPHPPSSPYPQI